MAGILNSGAPLLLELSNVAFNETVAAYFRVWPEQVCAYPNGLWIEDAGVYAPRMVSLVQVSGDPPQQNIDDPIPAIPFAELETGNYEDIFSFARWPFFRGFDVSRPRLTTVTGAMAIGYRLRPQDIATFDAFQTNALSSVHGSPHEFTMTCFLDHLMGVFSRASSDGVHLQYGSIPFMDEPEPVFQPPVTESPPAWENGRIEFINRYELTIGTDRINLNASFYVRLEFGLEPGSLLARVWVPPQEIDPDWDDETVFGGGFSDAERNATVAKLTFVFAKEIQRRFKLWGFLGTNAPAPIEHIRLGEATIRLMDERYTSFSGNQHPRLSCDGFSINGETMTLYGRILRDVPLPPHLTAVPDRAVFMETHDSACAGAEPPVFEREYVDLRNDGSGPLIVCPRNITITGPDAGHFQVRFTAPAGGSDYIEIAAGSTRRLSISYYGPAFSAQAILNIPTNDPLKPSLKIPLSVIPTAHAAFDVSPPTLLIERANNPMGAPLTRIANCRPVPVHECAAQFTVTNVGSTVLQICDLHLDDPDDVFSIVFTPRRVLPGHVDYFGVDFYPKEAGRIYSARCRLLFAAGQHYDLTIAGRVGVLPQPGGPGDWVDVGEGHVCVLLELLGKGRGFFEPVRDPTVIPIVDMTVPGVPPNSELIMRDDMGRTHVHDRSNFSDRRHSLICTANPDGGPMPEDPSRGEVVGDKPDGMGPFRVGIEGWLIRPDADVLPIDRPDVALFSRGFIYALGHQDGISIIDARGDRMTSEVHSVGRVDRLAIGRDQAALIVNDRLTVRDASPGKIGSVRAETRMERPATHVALIGGYVLTVDEEGVLVFGCADGRLKKVSHAVVPGGVRGFQAVPNGVVAMTSYLMALIDVQADGVVRIGSSVAFSQPVTGLSRGRSALVVHYETGAAQSYGIVNGKLCLIADYPLGHWSNSFLNGRYGGCLFRCVGKDGLQRYRVSRHEIDRSKFPEAFELRYRPQRPVRNRDARKTKDSNVKL